MLKLLKRIGHATTVDYDVVIIGGGIAGLYAAYTLSKNTDYKIAIFETNSSWGGRLAYAPSEQFLITPTIPWESKLCTLMQNLEVEFRIPSSNNPAPIIDFEKLSSDELAICKQSRITSDPLFICVVAYALKKILGDQWNFESLHTPNAPIRKSIIRRYGSYDGRSLTTYADVKQLLQQILSPECMRFVLTDPIGNRIMNLPGDATVHIIALLDVIEAYKWNFVYIPNGVQEIISKLIHHLETSNVKMQTMSTMQNVELSDNAHYCITFEDDTKTVCKRLIMAIAPEHICRVRGLPPHIYETLHDTMIHMSALNTFVISKHNHETLRVIKTRDKDTIIKDGVAVQLNKPTGQQTFADTLAERFADDDLHIFDMNAWGTTMWKSGADDSAILNALSAFNYRRGMQQRMHICGEAFSQSQGFIEGALASVEKIISRLLEHRSGRLRFSSEAARMNVG